MADVGGMMADVGGKMADVGGKRTDMREGWMMLMDGKLVTKGPLETIPSIHSLDTVVVFVIN